MKRYKYNRICHNCKAIIKKKDKFCPKCGVPVQRVKLIGRKREECKKHKIWVRNTKLVVIVVCIIFSICTTIFQKSAANTVFQQIKNQQMASAQMLYKNGVEDSNLSKKYLSLLLDHYLKQVKEAYEAERIQGNEAYDIFQTVKSLKIGKASEMAENYIKLLKEENI